jgi:hypothetical protein
MSPLLRQALIGLAFTCGAAIHAAGFVLHQFHIEIYGAGYPPWRHPTLAIVDALIGLIAFRRPRWLMPALLAFLAEQILTNGVPAFVAWRETGRVRWPVVIMHAAVVIALIGSRGFRIRKREAYTAP